MAKVQIERYYGPSHYWGCMYPPTTPTIRPYLLKFRALCLPDKPQEEPEQEIQENQ
jgi:hypothetical protein